MVNQEDERYLRIVKGFGMYHAFVSFPLAWPVLSAQVLEILGSLHEELSIPGVWIKTDATTLLFVNLFAALSVCWGIYRVRHASRIVGRYEGWAMIAFSAIVIWSVLQGASALWLIIAIVDGIGAFIHLLSRKRNMFV